MTGKPFEFEMLRIDELRSHEEIDPETVPALAEEIRRSGVFYNPIWVARGSLVILNGHHRVAALRRLGAVRVPAWVFDYRGPTLLLHRWAPGPPISKGEVERRGREGRLFPPKTTKHVLTVELPEKLTPLSELLSPAPTARAHRRASGSSRSPAAGASRSG